MLTNEIYRKRLLFLLDKNIHNIVCDNSCNKSKLKKYSQKILAIDSKKTSSILSRQSANNYMRLAVSDNLIYAIYTSGTTGNPKGVSVEHRSVINYVVYLIHHNKLNCRSIGSQYVAISFDALVIEMYPILLSGGTLCLIPEKIKIDPIKINNFFHENHITYAFLPTKFAELFFNSSKNTSLKNLLVGGEKLERFIKQPYRVTNAYGSTEASVQSTSFMVNKQYENIPIGKPIDNVKCYVVDKNLHLLPIGAIGELMIGGESLARGYIGQPKLTAKKFISDPLQISIGGKNKDGRLYRTGDLVRILPDGNLEYIGRNDDQIKIKGHRIELGEIESKLLNYPQIKQVAVIVDQREDNKHLVAYYLAGNQLDQSQLRDYLLLQLPDYMIPSAFVHLQQFPLTENGKLDRKALPKPNFTTQDEYIAPRNFLEKALCKIYAQVLYLPVQQVGIKNNFFSMGGDSISSIQIVSRIRQQLELEVAIQDIFNHKTIEQLAANILTNQHHKNVTSKISKEFDQTRLNTSSINTSSKDDSKENGYVAASIAKENTYLANSLQQGFIYYAARQARKDDTYTSQFIWEYKIAIDKNKFKKVWQLILKKHPSLRLRFSWDNELIQIIDEYQKLDFRYINLKSYSVVSFNYESQLEDIIHRDRREYYDLQKGNLIRIYLIKVSENNYTCMCSVHHIILDGWSCSVLIDNMHEVYLQLLQNYQPQISEDITYRKAQKYLQEQKNKHQKYWNNQTKKIQEEIDLRFLLKSSAQNLDIKNYSQVEQLQEQYVKVTGQIFFMLKNVCQINSVTINAVIQYVWHKILHIYGASNTTVVGTVVSGRNIPIDNIENTVGLFINTLPLVFVHNDELSFVCQIKDMQKLINDANDKSNVNLVDLQSKGKRLFDSLLVYENYPPSKHAATIKYENMREVAKADYPLVLIAYEKEQALMVRLQYAGELFSQEIISLLLNKLLFFIEQIADPSKKFLNYLRPEEYQRIVIDYNKTEKDYAGSKIVHKIFEEQASTNPNSVALTCGNKKMTFRELNEASNRLANYLWQSYVINPDDLIVLHLDRDEWLLVAMLGVLKSGAAYVPIDINYPDNRISYILKDTNTKIILTNKKYVKKLQRLIDQNFTTIDLIATDSEEMQSNLSNQKTFNPLTLVASNNIAYVIYTSGTTADPKGVMIEHKSLANFVHYVSQFIAKEDIAVSCINYSFDAINAEVYPALLNGNLLHMVDDNLRINIDDLYQFIVKNNISFIVLSAAIATEFSLNYDLSTTKLRVMIVGGEVYKGKLYEKIKIINQYGPTESTVCTTLHCYKTNDAYTNIGKPISNVKCYVTNANLNILPIGAVGELMIGGEGLARGYLNNSSLTSEKFVHNPFQTATEKIQNKNNKLYKSGDLVRMLSDGDLEFIGRNDSQVKVRGYRIELGEIEKKLTSYPGINQAIAIVNEESHNKYLIAYYITDKKLDEQKIKEYITRQLPCYMIPDAFIRIKKLPLTRNGKLDRKSLPKPKFINKDNYVHPKNKQEKLICETFANILSLKKIGANDDFFLLGGNSILAIKLASILQANFNVKVADIFDLRTPRRLAERSLFGKDFLQHKLEQIKTAYRKKQDSNNCTNANKKREQELDTYIKSIEGQSKLDISLKKPIHNVLLTGATGYLGCNILNQLLTQTNYNIYLLVRAISRAVAIDRVSKKYQFYFEEALDDSVDKRIFIFTSDIEQKNLGLSPEEYHNLTTKIDSVIHAAALVKHYGEYNKFYSANVIATINLLEFSKETSLKDFHYISTTGVLKCMSIANGMVTQCTEDDLPITTEVFNNVYVQTKLLGEHQIAKYQHLGLKCNVYRVGNLAFISKNYRAQENIEDNAFYNWLKYLFVAKCSTEAINTIEISQTDLTASAIIKIFDKKVLSNKTHHIFNPYLFDMTSVLKNKDFNVLSLEAFINQVSHHIKNKLYHDLAVKFLLHQGWLDWVEEKNVVSVEVLQNKTRHILRRLNFDWPLIDEKTLCDYFGVMKLCT